MEELLMKRQFPRYFENKAVVLENVELGFCQHATMINFSGSGLCCKTGMQHNPGNKIFVRIEKWPNKNSSVLYSGEVRWCKGSKANQISEYQVGVKIESIKSR
jgi:PilZ domain